MRRQETKAEGSPVTSQRTSKLSPRRIVSLLGVRLTAKVGAPVHVGKIPTERSDRTNNRRDRERKKRQKKKKKDDQTSENKNGPHNI